MEKYIYDNNNGLWYELQGDYYIPCLVLDEEDAQPIGMWGRKYLRYIKEHRPVLHTTLLLSGKLNSHLAEIDKRATEMFDSLVKQLAEKEGITEHLKAQDQTAWVGAMNNIRNAAEEIIAQETNLLLSIETIKKLGFGSRLQIKYCRQQQCLHTCSTMRLNS